MLFDLIVGNPPYTDTTKARQPIYHKIMMNAIGNSKAEQSWVIPTNWIRQKRLTEFRNRLFDSGLYSIKTLPFDYFTANVLTCVIKIIPGYNGPIHVNNFGNCYFYDYRKLGYVVLGDSSEAIDKLINNKPDTPYRFRRGVIDQATAIDCDRHRITTTYQNGHTEHTNETYNGDPNWYAISRFYYQPDDGTHVDYSHTYCIVENEIIAKQTINYLQSTDVANVLRQTRTIRTMDNTQLAFIPKLG